MLTCCTWLQNPGCGFPFLYHCELPVLEVGDQHRARRVRDRERRLDVRDDRLGRDSAGPEYRKLVGSDFDRIAVIRPVEILDADELRQADVDRRTMHRRKPGSDLDRADGVL